MFVKWYTLLKQADHTQRFLKLKFICHTYEINPNTEYLIIFTCDIEFILTG